MMQKLLCIIVICCLGIRLNAQTKQLLVSRSDDNYVVEIQLDQASSLEQIALQYNVAVDLLSLYNSYQKPQQLAKGDLIVIPLTETNYFKTSSVISKSYKYEPVYYKINNGERAQQICKRFLISENNFNAWNKNESNPSVVQVGWLKIGVVPDQALSVKKYDYYNPKTEKKYGYKKEDLKRDLSKISTKLNAAFKKKVDSSATKVVKTEESLKAKAKNNREVVKEDITPKIEEKKPSKVNSKPELLTEADSAALSQKLTPRPNKVKPNFTSSVKTKSPKSESKKLTKEPVIEDPNIVRSKAINDSLALELKQLENANKVYEDSLALALKHEAEVNKAIKRKEMKHNVKVSMKNAASDLEEGLIEIKNGVVLGASNSAAWLKAKSSQITKKRVAKSNDEANMFNAEIAAINKQEQDFIQQIDSIVNEDTLLSKQQVEVLITKSEEKELARLEEIELAKDEPKQVTANNNLLELQRGKATWFYSGGLGNAYGVFTNVAPKGTELVLFCEESHKSIVAKVLGPLSKFDIEQGTTFIIGDNAKAALGAKSSSIEVVASEAH